MTYTSDGPVLLPHHMPPTAIDPWVHRSENMSCATCMWYVRKQAASPALEPGRFLPEVGRCRRHAPTMGGYPVVYATDWCGDHKLDETRAR